MLIGVVATAFACACYPINVAPECRARANECLKGCSVAAAEMREPDQPFNTHDVRSDCEKRCHELCQSLVP